MISCRLPVTAPSKSWISNKCYGTRYEEVEVHVASHKWSTEGNSVIHHPIYEPSKKPEQQRKQTINILNRLPVPNDVNQLFLSITPQ